MSAYLRWQLADSRFGLRDAQGNRIPRTPWQNIVRGLATLGAIGGLALFLLVAVVDHDPRLYAGFAMFGSLGLASVLWHLAGPPPPLDFPGHEDGRPEIDS